jgi:hypothetical protein
VQIARPESTRALDMRKQKQAADLLHEQSLEGDRQTGLLCEIARGKRKKLGYNARCDEIHRYAQTSRAARPATATTAAPAVRPL